MQSTRRNCNLMVGLSCVQSLMLGWFQAYRQPSSWDINLAANRTLPMAAEMITLNMRTHIHSHEQHTPPPHTHMHANTHMHTHMYTDHAHSHTQTHTLGSGCGYILACKHLRLSPGALWCLLLSGKMSVVKLENIPLLGSSVNHVLTYPSHEQGQYISYVTSLLVPALTAINTHPHAICHRNGAYPFRVIACK